MKLQPIVSPTYTLWVFHHSGRLERRVAPTISPTLPSYKWCSRVRAAPLFGVGPSRQESIWQITPRWERASSDFPWVICEAAPRSLSDTPQRIWIAVQNTDSKDTKLPW